MDSLLEDINTMPALTAGLDLLLLLPRWLTCCCAATVGDEPLHDQYVAWVLLLLHNERLVQDLFNGLIPVVGHH